MLLFAPDNMTELKADLLMQGITLTTGDGWLRVSRPGRAGPAAIGLDAPGLWKQSGTQHVFDAPLAATVARVEELDGDGDAQAAVASMLASWAMQTIGGGVPRGWTPPPDDRLAELVPAAALSFHSGSFIEAARLVAGERTLRVQVSLGRLDITAPAARRAWADELIAGTSRLRMVRVGLRAAPAGNPDDRASIEAAVDLTGAPRPIAEALLPAAVDALRHCFVFFVPTATLIGDAGCASRVLDTTPSRITPA